MTDPARAAYLQEHLDRTGDRLGLHVYEPPSPHAPLVLLWPAMGVPARYYRPFASALLEQGLWPVVVDLRGTGTSTPRPGRASRYGYAELVGDVGAVLDGLAARRAGRATILLGHSLGGQLCTLHLARASANPTAAGVAGLVLVAVGLPYWRCYPGVRRAAVLGFTQAIGLASALLRVWPGWAFGGRQARRVMRDWAYTARTGRFPQLSDVDVGTALGATRTPVLAVSVEHDRHTPPATTERLLAKLTAAPVERAHYTAAEAGAPLDHFLWVRASAKLAARVAAFAAAR